MNEHSGLCTHWWWCSLKTLMQLDATIDDVTGWQSHWRHRLWRRVTYKAKSCFCLAVYAHSTLACITGALRARRCKRGILHEARDEGRRKNKAPVKSPLLWLFRPPTLTNIDWRRWCQKDQWKVDPLLKTCYLLGYQKHRQQHKPQEITNTREWITFNNVRLSAAKLIEVFSTKV